MRVADALKYYPVAVVFFTAVGVLFLFTKGHGVVRLLTEVLDGRHTEREIIIGIVVTVTVAVSAGMLYVIRGMIKLPLFEEHYFCGLCNVVDKDDEAVCPLCHQALKTRETFFFTLYDDEMLLADSFGLTPSNEI